MDPDEIDRRVAALFDHLAGYETAEPDEWWCGVCKTGHKLGAPCPDTGEVVE